MKLRFLKKVAVFLLTAMIINSFSGCKIQKLPEASSSEVSSEISSDISSEASSSESAGEIVRKDIGNTVSYAVSNLPSTIDPSLVLSSSTDAEIVYHVSDGLVRIHNGKVMPSIAESYETDDNVTFTFHLREAYWEDAVRITADDFYYTFRRILDKSNKGAIPEELLMIKGAMAYRAGNVEASELGIKAVDSKTFEITLDEPNPFFIELLAADTQSFLVRKDIIFACGESFGKSAGTYLSCGPYRLKNWTEEEIVLEKNPMYWDSGNVTLDAIKCLKISDGATREVLYEAGECNTYIEFLSSNENKYEDAKRGKENTLTSLALNFDSEVLANENFRKAISYAIDREKLVSDYAGIAYCAADRFLPKGFFPGYDYDVAFTPGTKADTQKAGEALTLAMQELELTLETLPELVFVSANTVSAKKTTESIITMLRNNLNLTNIRVVYVSPETAVEYYCTGNYDIYVLSSSAPCDLPVWQLRRWRTNSIYNLSGFTSETFDGYDMETNIKEAEELIISYAPEIPLYYKGFVYGFADNVSGIGISNSGVKLQFQYAKVSEIKNNP